MMPNVSKADNISVMPFAAATEVETGLFTAFNTSLGSLTSLLFFTNQERMSSPMRSRRRMRLSEEGMRSWATKKER